MHCNKKRCIFLFIDYIGGYLSFRLQSLRKAQKMPVQRCSILVYCILFWRTFAIHQHYKVWQSPKCWLPAGQQEIPTTIKEFIVYKNYFPGAGKLIFSTGKNVKHFTVRRNHASLFLLIISNSSSWKILRALKENQQTVMVNHMALFLLRMKAIQSEKPGKLMTKNKCTHIFLW